MDENWASPISIETSRCHRNGENLRTIAGAFSSKPCLITGVAGEVGI